MPGMTFNITVDDAGTIVVDKFGKNIEKLGKRVDDTGGRFDKLGRMLGTIGSKFHRLTGTIFSLKGALAGMAGAAGIGLTVKAFIAAASASEQYRVRLEVLLGDTREANRLFKDMTDYAAKVPFTYDKIMASATALSGVMKGGVDQIKEWMPMVGDLAAAAGLSIEQTTSQIIRMYSAGAAAADLFRERGILAMMGFQAGVSYSAEETANRMIDAWERADSKFRGAADKLGQTWVGLTSMVSDRWFQVREKVMKAGVFEMLKTGVDNLIKKVDEFAESGKLEEWTNYIGSKVTGTINLLIDHVNNLKKAFDLLVFVTKAYISYKTAAYIGGIAEAAISAAKEIKTLGNALLALRVKIVGLGFASKAGLVGFALFGGWELGTWLQEKFDIVKKFGIAWMSAVHMAYEKFKMEISITLQEIKLEAIKAYNWAEDIAIRSKNLLSFLPWIEKTQTIDIAYTPLNEGLIINQIENIKDIYRTKLNEIDEIYAEMFADVGKAGEMAAQKTSEAFNKMPIIPNILTTEPRVNVPKPTVTEEYMKQWEDFSQTAADTLCDALAGGTDDWIDKLKHDFKRIIIDQTIGQELKVAMDKIFGPKGYLNMPMWGETGKAGSGPTWGQGIGAGMMAYGAYQNRESLDMASGAGYGGMMGGMLAGGTMGGIWGAVIGAAIGGINQAIEDMKSPKPLPTIKIDLIYETINDQIELVSDSWKNTPKNDALIMAIENMLQNQIDFYTSMGRMTGQIPSDNIKYVFDIYGWKKDYKSMVKGFTNIIPLLGLIENLGAGTDIGGAQFRTDLLDKMVRIFSDMAYEPISSWAPGQPRQIFSDILNIADPQKRVQEFLDWALTAPKFETNIGKEIIGQMPAEFMGEADKAGIEKFVDNLKTKFETFQAFLAPAIGDAFNAGLATSNFQTFKDTLKGGIAESIIAGLKEGFIINQIMPEIFKAFEEKRYFEMIVDAVGTGVLTETSRRPSLVDLMSQYMGGDIGLPETLTYVKAMFTDMGDILGQLEPVWDTFNTGIQDLSQTLGLNTGALMQNTEALIGPVESFLRELNVGQFAPVQSLEGLRFERAGLYTKAFADPGAFSEYASYMRSTYLPQMQTLGEYQKTVMGVRGEVGALPWYQNVASQSTSPTAAEIGAAVAQSMATYGSTAGEGMHIHLYISGREITTEVIKEAKNNPDLAEEWRNI